MPMYRYHCNVCGHEFRVLHVKDSPDCVVCPSCQSSDAQRQLPRVAVQFKGSGYYKTDRAGKASKAGTRGASDKPDTGGETSSTETGPSKPSSNDASRSES